MKKYFNSLNLVLAIEVATVILTSSGLIPREAVLFLTGLIIFYMIFSPPENSLWLFTASIPLFVAMPISDSSDSIANWRILIGVLFLCLFFKQGVSLSLIKDSKTGRWRLRENLKHGWLEYLTLAFLTIAAVSIFVATFKLVAFKQLIFIISAFLLFLIIENIAQKGSFEKNKKMVIRLWQAAAVGGITVIAVSLIQFSAILFIPLYAFWQFWTDKVINVFYGQNLSHLLSYSNTWFAYYASNPPTLRLFSVFPDSHSFAMFNILMTPIFFGLALFFKDNKRKKIFYWLMTGLALMGVVLSGSRGAWLSVVPVAIAALIIYAKKIESFLTKKVLLSLIVFALLFVASVGYPPVLYKFQSWQGSNASTTFSFFERARSISDAEELSNKGRLEIWLTSLKSVVKHPILGVGFGNYAMVLNEDISAAKKGVSAHNLYLDFASEIGIFGTLLLITIFINILYTAWRVFKSPMEPHFKAYGLIFGLYFLWVAGYSFFDVVLLNDKVLLILMVGLAALYSLRRKAADPQRA